MLQATLITPQTIFRSVFLYHTEWLWRLEPFKAQISGWGQMGAVEVKAGSIFVITKTGAAP